MFQRLLDLFKEQRPEPVKVSRLIRPMLSTYARTRSGSFMLIEIQHDEGESGNGYEIYCMFRDDAASAAADYARQLMEGLGLKCAVHTKTHNELLNHLMPHASFVYERRSLNRKAA